MPAQSGQGFRPDKHEKQDGGYHKNLDMPMKWVLSTLSTPICGRRFLNVADLMHWLVTLMGIRHLLPLVWTAKADISWYEDHLTRKLKKPANEYTGNKGGLHWLKKLWILCSDPNRHWQTFIFDRRCRVPDKYVLEDTFLKAPKHLAASAHFSYDQAVRRASHPVLTLKLEARQRNFADVKADIRCVLEILWVVLRYAL